MRKLISQDFVRHALAGEVGKVMPKIHPKQWNRLAQMMLDACIVEEGTDELKLKGAARSHIRRYLAETPFIACLTGETVQNQQRPMIFKGTVTILAADLQMFINKATCQNLSVIAVASMVAALGSKSVRIREGLKDQNRWALPVEEVDPKDYPEHDREDHGNAE